MRESAYHLIHANIAIMRAPFDDPRMADFLAMADKIDALAQAASGFVAQPEPPDEGAVYTGTTLLNLSIWESVEHLKQFTHAGQHARALERRTEWFEQSPGRNYVLFWLPAGEIPTEEEVARRMDYLVVHGPTPYAFSLDESFTIRDLQHFEIRSSNA
jgi:hypothetical protein